MMGVGGVAIAAARCPSEPNIFTMNLGVRDSCLGGKALSMAMAPDMTMRCRFPKSLGLQVATNCLARAAVPMATSFQVSLSAVCLSSSFSVANSASFFRYRPRPGLWSLPLSATSSSSKPPMSSMASDSDRSPTDAPCLFVWLIFNLKSTPKRRGGHTRKGCVKKETLSRNSLLSGHRMSLDLARRPANMAAAHNRAHGVVPGSVSGVYPHAT